VVVAWAERLHPVLQERMVLAVVVAENITTIVQVAVVQE
jgi:hypothetical protein